MRGSCDPNQGTCPPPAAGSALLATWTPGEVTLAFGTPAIDGWKESEHEWRYVLWQDRWVREMDDRGSAEQ